MQTTQSDTIQTPASPPISSQKIQLSPTWMKYLGEEFEKPYMQSLRSFLVKRHEAKAKIYPKGSQIFASLNLTSLTQAKVVILGQDPYHGPGQAHGLSFSVPEGVRCPPSLQNIYKELHADLGLPIPKKGDLTNWAKQGVILLNATLTVEDGKAGAHQNKGWEQFTDKIVEILNHEKEHLVFILWGSFAQKKGAAIDRKKHCVLEAPHPSPLSSHRGFFGSKPFSKTNAYLTEHGREPINWAL